MANGSGLTLNCAVQKKFIGLIQKLFLNFWFKIYAIKIMIPSSRRQSKNNP